jgi:hypothetical protein
MSEQNTPAQDRLLTKPEMNELWYKRASTHIETTKIEDLLEDAAKEQHNITVNYYETVVIPAIEARMIATSEEAIQKVLDSQDERIKQARQELIAEIELSFRDGLSDLPGYIINAARWEKFKQDE